MVLSKMPDGFSKTKEALFNHMKILWGLFEQRAIPPIPNPQTIVEFNCQFYDSQEISNVIDNLSSATLIAKNKIATLKNAWTGQKKIGWGIVHVEQFFILHVYPCMGRAGIWIWAPDLDDAPDYLYNKACWLISVKKFHQVAAGGAYEYMSINLCYIEDIGLLTMAYNHYVHFVMSQHYQKESKEAGKHNWDEEKKVIQKGRQQLWDAQCNFACDCKLTKRYQKILNNVNVHSNNEYNPKLGVYIIKNLPFRSQSANIFFCWIHEEMIKANQVEGKGSQRRKRCMPKTPRMSEALKAPPVLPIDYYNVTWFNNLTPTQKTIIANMHNVAFLPNPNLSQRGTQHPDEKKSSKLFTKIYWELGTKIKIFHMQLRAVEMKRNWKKTMVAMEVTAGRALIWRKNQMVKTVMMRKMIMRMGRNPKTKWTMQIGGLMLVTRTRPWLMELGTVTMQAWVVMNGKK